MAISIPARALCAPIVWRRARAAALALCLSAGAAHAVAPPIRSSPQNVVPKCVTPERLMAYVKTRNPDLDPRFAGIAQWYKRHGEAWRVRWDYAFFQMAVETNFLTFKRGDGRWGDVRPKQNNFAGLGTTGGGVAGDSYPDVATGVLAQIQHLVVYSGEHIAAPVGARTKLKQDDIIESMARFNGSATFADLSRRWAADKHYGAAIEWVAGGYRGAYCNKPEAEAAATQPRGKGAPLASAAALGGPSAAGRGVVSSPVRTVWSRSTERQGADAAPPAATSPDNAKEMDAKDKPADGPAPEPASRPLPAEPASRSAPAPEHKPAPAVAVPSQLAVAPAAGPEPEAKAEPKSEAESEAKSETPRGDAAARSPFGFAAALNVDALTESPKPQPVSAARRCRVLSASYGGKKTLLVLAHAEGEARYTALTVLDGFERSMLASYVKAHAPGGASLGEFSTRDGALAKAKELCPGRAEAPRRDAAG